MTADASPSQALLLLQRRNYLFAAGALLLNLALHCLVTWTLPPRMLLLIPPCIGILVFTGVMVGRGWLSLRRGAVCAGCVALVTTPLFVLLSGGPASPYYHVFITLPFIMAAYAPDSPLPALAGGGAALLAELSVSGLAHVPVATLLLQAVSTTSLTAIALIGSHVYQRMVHTQQATHEERMRTLDQLTESERLRGRAERERAEVDRLVLVGQLAAGVAHEVNNPLAYVKANLSHLLREARDATRLLDRQELEEVLDETHQGVLRIQQIITDLRGFSRASAPGEEEGGLLESAVQEAQRLVSVRLRAGGEVTVVLAPGLPRVRLGQRHLVQVLVNLMLNAADASELAPTPLPIQITVNARPVEGGVSLQVEDNGPGIPPDVMPRLFEPFFTTKPPGKGTGLGLALCREHVTRAGGTLHAENRPEGGARFVMRLPLAEESPPAPATAG